MITIYLQAWQTAGPGRWERDGNVTIRVRQMMIQASHVHAAQGFPFNGVA